MAYPQSRATRHAISRRARPVVPDAMVVLTQYYRSYLPSKALCHRGGTRCYAMHGTELAYGAMRWLCDAQY
eukprot:1973382-Rhodomonas_salina.2